MIYLQLLWVYLKIGTFGFGGGYAMLSLIQHEIVDIHHWLTPQQFIVLLTWDMQLHKVYGERCLLLWQFVCLLLF